MEYMEFPGFRSIPGFSAPVGLELSSLRMRCPQNSRFYNNNASVDKEM